MMTNPYYKWYEKKYANDFVVGVVIVRMDADCLVTFDNDAAVIAKILDKPTGLYYNPKTDECNVCLYLTDDESLSLCDSHGATIYDYDT